jgi:hypothetical protein
VASLRLDPGSPLARTIPTAAVVIAPIACALAATSSKGGIVETLSSTAIPLCMVATAIFALIQPRPLHPSSDGPLDEREAALRWKAYAQGMGVTSLLGMLICFYAASTFSYGWRQPSHDDWDNLLLLVICWIFGMPMAFANWMVGKPLDDEDDQ